MLDDMFAYGITQMAECSAGCELPYHNFSIQSGDTLHVQK